PSRCGHCRPPICLRQMSLWAGPVSVGHGGLAKEGRRRHGTGFARPPPSDRTFLRGAGLLVAARPPRAAPARAALLTRGGAYRVRFVVVRSRRPCRAAVAKKKRLRGGPDVQACRQ